MRQSLWKTILTTIPLLLGMMVWLSIAAPMLAAEESSEKKAAEDSLRSPREEYFYLRGIKQDYKEGGGKALRTIGNILLFIPRLVTDALFVSAGYGASLMDDNLFIADIRDFLYIYNGRFGWYPIVNLSSGSQLGIGAALLYNKDTFGIGGAGFFSKDEIWAAKLKANYRFINENTVWQVNISGEIGNREDLEFYGFGADPRTDPRNSFQPETSREFGIYAQRRTKAQLILGMRPTRRWQFFYTGWYSERRLSEPSEESPDNLGNVFELAVLPGTADKIQQVYNELAARYDTRRYNMRLSPGVQLQGYLGISSGVGNDRSRFLRGGVDMSLYLPVIRKNRLLVPRIIFDATKNLRDEVEIPFPEYPREPAFRGVSPKTMLRTDKLAMVPSLEYQWPLTNNLNGSLFLDYLLVADSFGKFTFANAPYAYGVGMNVHDSHNELGRVAFINGSEGLRIAISIGFSPHASDRSKWQ